MHFWDKRFNIRRYKTKRRACTRCFDRKHRCSSSIEKNCGWFEQVNAEENALGSNKTTQENRKRHRLIDYDNDNGIHSISKCNKNQQRMVKYTCRDQLNPLPELTKKVKCVNIDCEFFLDALWMQKSNVQSIRKCCFHWLLMWLQIFEAKTKWLKSIQLTKNTHIFFIPEVISIYFFYSSLLKNSNSKL